MKELYKIILLVILFAAAGLATLYISTLITDFTFYKAELSIDGSSVTERLYFSPDTGYHTLYRNFKDRVVTPGETTPGNAIEVSRVSCSAGTPYVRNSYGACIVSGVESNCLAHTENNEYGCTFGSNIGFFEDADYWIEAEYTLHPENVFEIDNERYIKFVVYEEDRHGVLTLGDTFIINGIAQVAPRYFPRDQVIIYIPYMGSIDDVAVVPQESFLYDGIPLAFVWNIIVALLPAFAFGVVWFFFGRERSYEELPSQLSFAPSKRPGWEVAAFFDPPFNAIDQNFFSTMLLSLYHRKIIDIKMKEKKLWLKITDEKKPMDDVESKFLRLLDEVFVSASHRHIDEEGYVYLKKALRVSSWHIRDRFREVYKAVKNEGKQYIDNTAYPVLLGSVIGLVFLFRFVYGDAFPIFVAYFAFFALVSVIIMRKSALFIRFKRDFYKEYQKWQSFKAWLSDSFAITKESHKAVVLWEQYLVYGAALGVSKRVIKELRQKNIIDDNQYFMYLGIHHTSARFASASPGGRGGRGFGGAGGGGIGGGGGGGR